MNLALYSKLIFCGWYFTNINEISLGICWATSQEDSHFTRNMLATSQENATSLEMLFKLTIHFKGKCDFTGNGVKTISLKLFYGRNRKLKRVEPC